MHHPKADLDRLYLPRTSGGRGLTQIETAYKTTTVGLQPYLKHSEDTLLQLVGEHGKRKKLYSIQKEGETFRQELDVRNLGKGENQQPTVYAKSIKQKTKNRAQDNVLRNEEKALHGRYPKRTKEEDVDQNKTKQWLRSTGLKAETEGLIIAAQDLSLATTSKHAIIIKDGTDPICRICNRYKETIDYIVSGCPELAKTEYIQRHNKAAASIHWKTCQHYNIQVSDKWYEHEPARLTDTLGYANTVR